MQIVGLTETALLGKAELNLYKLPDGVDLVRVNTNGVSRYMTTEKLSVMHTKPRTVPDWFIGVVFLVILIAFIFLGLFSLGSAAHAQTYQYGYQPFLNESNQQERSLQRQYENQLEQDRRTNQFFENQQRQEQLNTPRQGRSLLAPEYFSPRF